MLAGRALVAVAAATGLVMGLATPAPAARRSPSDEPVQHKTVKGVDGRTGTAARYADQRDGRTVNSVTMTATDSDGPRGDCTETWVDYGTKPHEHFNPGVLVNCSGGTRRLPGAMTADYDGVVGMSVVVCEVPDTAGPIRRDESNCRGGLSGMSLHSGRRYHQFEVDAPQQPSGVRIWRA
jgi:hypothetical protein